MRILLNRKKSFFVLLNSALIITILFLELEYVRSLGYLVYGFNLLFLLFTLYNFRNSSFLLFSPSFIALFYVNLSFFMGQYVIANNIGFDLRYFAAYNSNAYLREITIYFLLCNIVLFLALNFRRLSQVSQTMLVVRRSKLNYFYTFFLLLILLFFGLIHIDLSLIGGQGDFSYAFKLATIIFLVLYIFQYGKSFKYLLYFLVLLFVLVGSYDSKREIFFILIFFLFVELAGRNRQISFKFSQLFLSILVSVLAVYIVVVSSISRGYGNFDVSNPLEASQHVRAYLSSDFAADALTANFELATTFGNTSNAVNYVMNDEVDLLYGSTFLKIFFIPFPRYIFPEKPESIINLYTRKFAPDFRDRGGSYPVGIYGEVFWNFSWFGLGVILLMFQFLNRVYFSILEHLNTRRIFNLSYILGLYLYITFIQFIRGSGLELWMLYAIVAMPMIFFLKFIQKLFDYNEGVIHYE